MEFAQTIARHVAFAIARRRVETALRESETLLRTVIQCEPACVKLLDLNGCILDMNSAGLSLIEADSLDQVDYRKMV